MFSTLIIEFCRAPNPHITVISEGSCDALNPGVMAAENSAWPLQK